MGFKPNGKLQNWKQMPEGLLRVQSFYWMHEGDQIIQKILMCSLVKRLGRAVVLKHVAEPLKCSAKLFKHLAKLLKYSADLLKNSLDILKSLAKCLCYNTAHAVLISHGTRREWTRVNEFRRM